MGTLMMTGCSSNNQEPKEDAFDYTVEQFADLQLLRYKVHGFEELPLEQKKLVYYLSEAALQGRDILFDQNGKYNLIIRKMLETVYTDYQGDRNDANFKAMETYLKRVWFSNGIHHHYAADKFVPGFTPEFFKQALESVDAAKLPLAEGETLEALCNEVFPVIFDAKVMAKRVNQADGEDLVLTSASNYYDNVNQAEAEAFYGKMKNPNDTMPVMFGMNSRLVKENGKVQEKVWKSGGLYGQAIDKIIYWLEKALTVAENDKQKAVIEKMIQFYKDGDLKTFDEYAILWVKDLDSRVDFVNGFTESYGDPLGMKASWESIVNFKDLVATKRTETISDNAQWFEDNSPVDPRLKKNVVKGVTANVVCAAMLGGEEYPSTAIGINLPNADWIREQYGSKSITISNITAAYSKASKGNGFRQEYIDDEEMLTLIDKYGHLTDDLHTDLHECLGHGSGQLLPGVDADALGVHGSTIEETRADLFALYYIADQKMHHLGLTPTPDAWHSNYYTYMLNGLMTQLVRIKPGCHIEEAHMRNRALIAHWCLEQSTYWAQVFGTIPAMELVKSEGKTRLVIHDYPTLRQFIGQLLAEIQRIKSEGDTLAAKHLVEKYGVEVDSTLHQEVLQRYEALDLAPYKGFINPRYTLVTDTDGKVTDVGVSYDETFDQQMLRYGREYN